jgi:hypothetical protein
MKTRHIVESKKLTNADQDISTEVISVGRSEQAAVQHQKMAWVTMGAVV